VGKTFRLTLKTIRTHATRLAHWGCAESSIGFTGPGCIGRSGSLRPSRAGGPAEPRFGTVPTAVGVVDNDRRRRAGSPNRPLAGRRGRTRSRSASSSGATFGWKDPTARRDRNAAQIAASSMTLAGSSSTWRSEDLWMLERLLGRDAQATWAGLDWDADPSGVESSLTTRRAAADTLVRRGSRGWSRGTVADANRRATGSTRRADWVSGGGEHERHWGGSSAHDREYARAHKRQRRPAAEAVRWTDGE